MYKMPYREQNVQNPPQLFAVSVLKAALVDVGVVALALGDVALVQAVTSLIDKRRWADA